MLFTDPGPATYTPPMPSRGSGRILLVLVAHHAEERVARVLERIPQGVLGSDRWDLLLIEDSSGREAALAARRWVDARGFERARVLVSPVDLGYGEIQKLALRHALDGGYELVVVLPADGQYPPEDLPRFAEVYDGGDADVILASRFVDGGDPGSGKMPLIQRAGNRFVTWLQNRLCGQRLSEYHTGFRAYSAAFLSEIPFEFDANEYDFDTDVLLQAFYAGAQIVEIPTRVDYDNRIRSMGRVRYARRVLSASLGYRLHRMGIFCSLKFRGAKPLLYEDKTAVLYSSHAAALECVRRLAPQTLLDIGCGPGFVAARCEEMGVRVTGLDFEEPLPGNMTRFIRADLDGEFSEDAFEYDVVLMLDVIEHLVDPERFLVGLRNGSEVLGRSSERARLVLSTPNVAFAAVRLNLLLGRFTYAERGILDIDHKRLFTRATLLRAVRDCGYDVEKVSAIGAPFAAVFPGPVGAFAGWCSDRLARLMPRLFAFQFLVVARPRPGLRQLLAASAEVDEDSAAEATPAATSA